MPSYNDRISLIGKLKRSAIDAWMHDIGWSVTATHYTKITPGRTPITTTVTRPGTAGVGGGHWEQHHLGTVIPHTSPSQDEGFKSHFAAVGEHIDELVKHWLDLPDPEEIGKVVESCRQAERRLSVTASSSGGEVTGAAPLVGYLKLIEQNVETMSGAAIEAYKSKFLIQLGSVISGFHAVSIVRGADVIAQQSLWEAARQDFADILNEGRKTMDMVASGATSNWEQALTVVGLAAEGLSLFLPGTASKVLNFGLSILKEGAPDKPPKRLIDTYDTAIRTLRTMLDRLSDKIATEELRLKDNIVKNEVNIRNDRSSFDLTQPPPSSGDGLIVMQPERVHEITHSYMPFLADELDAVATIVRDCGTYSAVRRDDSIGMGAIGPSSQLRDLNDLHYDMVKDLSWEVRNGAKDLELVMEDFEQHEQENLRAIQKLTEEIDQGSPFTNWG